MKKESLPLRFLYGTLPGRMLLWALVRPSFSKMAGIFLDTGYSRWLIPFFIRRHAIEMDGYEEKRYASFNDFFTRKRCADMIDITPGHLISPCDGWLTVYPVNGERAYRIKHVEYPLERLLGSRTLASRFAGGTCLIFRLTPQDYHRYCYACGGTVARSKTIPGKLHCVRPIAYTDLPVFVENSREFVEIDTGQYGKIVQMEIGALFVGKIRNHPGDGKAVQGVEKGFFEFGGSTIVVLTEKGGLRVDKKIIQNMRQGVETSVRLGERVGVLHQKGVGTENVQRACIDR